MTEQDIPAYAPPDDDVVPAILSLGSVRCERCGFYAEGTSEADLARAFTAHRCDSAAS